MDTEVLQASKDQGWEVEMVGVGESGGGKMETTVLNNKNIYIITNKINR